jgi:hypothetical protein
MFGANSKNAQVSVPSKKHSPLMFITLRERNGEYVLDVFMVRDYSYFPLRPNRRSCQRDILPL